MAPETGAEELQELMRGVVRRDRAAFAALYDRTAPLFGIAMRILCQREEAEDVLQEAFVAVWDRAASFDPERGSVMTWLVTVLRHRAIDRRRRRAHLKDRLGSEEDLLALTAGASDESDRGAGLAALQKCLAELEERPRRVVLLAYAYGYTHEELARQLSTPIGTVKSWVRVGAERGLLQKPALALAVQFQGDHKKHAEILTGTISKMGGAPAMAKKPADYGFPTASLKSQADVLRFAANLEQGAASAYLGAVPAFMSKDLAKYAASILGDEAMHRAVLRRALGENPVPAAFIS